ncbi:hypothetical protein [Microtetraspora sp. AC03309]|uniref:hypothetical protein n=1 Tax=Microtetraspora sp. AC03309 TaxID=2779376 RepID=UPI001E449494|nr:hypothetical protein [Microtetraspora sp. AC03309]
MLGQLCGLRGVPGVDEPGEQFQCPVDARGVRGHFVFVHEAWDEDGTVELSPNELDAVCARSGRSKLGQQRPMRCAARSSRSVSSDQNIGSCGTTQTTSVSTVVVAVAVTQVRLGARGEELRELLRRLSSGEQADQLATLLARNTGGKREHARLRAVMEDPAAQQLQVAYGGGEQPILEEDRLAVGKGAYGDTEVWPDLPDLEQSDRDLLPGLEQLPLVVPE